jgi:hypothetical protein
VRLPLATDLKTSISDVTKDARLINAHAETRGGIQRVKKRPGALATGWNFTTPIQGLFGGGLLYLIYNDEFSIVDVDNPPPGEVLIGDLVGGYYAMIDNPPTSPGPGDAYWSATPSRGVSVRGLFLAPGFGVDMSLSPLSVGPWRDLMRGGHCGVKRGHDQKLRRHAYCCWAGLCAGLPQTGFLPTGPGRPIDTYRSAATNPGRP